MNKFEKKAMAKRAYRALVKMGGGGLIQKDPYYEERPAPGMMTQYEFEHNGENFPYNNSKFPIGHYTWPWQNAARPNEIPENSPEHIIAEVNSDAYPRGLSRPFGPVFSPSVACRIELDRRNGKDKDPITGLTPRSYYNLTGQHLRPTKMDSMLPQKNKYTVNSPYILLDDTPEP